MSIASCVFESLCVIKNFRGNIRKVSPYIYLKNFRGNLLRSYLIGKEDQGRAEESTQVLCKYKVTKLDKLE